MKKLLLVVLIVPQTLLLIGCSRTWVREHHQWPEEEAALVQNGRFWNGMTVEQYECSLGQLKLLYHSHGLICAFIDEGCPWAHTSPQEVFYENGMQVRVYQLAWSDGTWAGSHAIFNNGRLVLSGAGSVKTR